jgi:hypothetical protein
MTYEEWGKAINIAIRGGVYRDTYTVVIGYDGQIIEYNCYWGDMLESIEQAKQAIYPKFYDENGKKK